MFRVFCVFRGFSFGALRKRVRLIFSMQQPLHPNLEILKILQSCFLPPL